MKRIFWKAYRGFVLKPYSLFTWAGPVWYHYVNRKSKKLFIDNPPELDPVQSSIVKDLKETGLAITSLDELFPNESMLASLKNYAVPLINKAETKTGKTFLKFLWDPRPVVERGNLFAKLALDGRIIDIINSYIGVYSKLRAMTLNITVPVQEREKPRASQKWHRDSDDKIICKIFIYLNDVDENSGPFTYLPRSQYKGKYRSLYPQSPPDGSVPPRGAVEKIVPEKDILRCTGKAGTVIFADTSGLHQGGYATKDERVMFTGAYYAGDCIKFPKPLYSLSPEFTRNFESSNPSPAARYAVSDSPERMFRKFHMFAKKLLKPKKVMSK